MGNHLVARPLSSYNRQMPTFEWPGEKLAMRIWETAEKFGVGMLRPSQIRREGRANAEVEALRLLLLAKAEKDVDDLKGGNAHLNERGEIVRSTVPILPQFSELPKSSDHRHPSTPENLQKAPRLGSALDYSHDVMRGAAIREVTRAINLEQIVHRAETEARSEPDESVSSETIAPDWFARWRDNAQDVSDLDIQLLWARTLAGEIQTPGRYSLRTLDFLRSISKHEAELIQMLAPFSFEQFIFKDSDLHERSGLGFARLVELQDLGVMSGVGATLHWQLAVPKESAGATGFTCRNLCVAVTGFTKPLSLPCYLLTNLGREVISLGKFDVDRRCVNSVVNTLIQAGATCVVGPSVMREGRNGIGEPMETFSANHRAPVD